MLARSELLCAGRARETRRLAFYVSCNFPSCAGTAHPLTRRVGVEASAAGSAAFGASERGRSSFTERAVNGKLLRKRARIARRTARGAQGLAREGARVAREAVLGDGRGRVLADGAEFAA